MEEQKQRKEDFKKQQKKLDEIDYLRVQNERQQLLNQVIDEQMFNKMEHKNLNESDIDPILLKKYKQQQQQKIDIQNKELAEMKKKGEQPVKIEIIQEEEPIQEELPPRINEDRIKLEEKMLRELPIEITQQVTKTVNEELYKLRNEMNFQQNGVSEQILELKSQLLDAHQRRQATEEQLRILAQELRKTQIQDEIRQREIYNAFILEDKNTIIEDTNTKKILLDDIDFNFPSRPVPYYNPMDPYINEDEIIQNQNNPLDNESIFVCPNQQFQEDNILIKQEKQKGVGHLAAKLTNEYSLPADYQNRQNIYQPNIDNEDVNYDNICHKNAQKLDVLENRRSPDSLDIQNMSTVYSNNPNNLNLNYNYSTVGDITADIDNLVNLEQRLYNY